MGIGTGLSRRRAAAAAGAPSVSLIQGAKKCDCGSGFRIGACGCSGGGGLTRGPAIAAVAPSSVPAAGGWVRSCSCDAPMFPRGFDPAQYQDALARLNPEEPYVDMLHDFMTMDVLYSNITTIPPTAAGTVTNVQVLPEAGCFLAFYWRIIVRTGADGIQQVDWTYRRPRVQGCPIECDNLDRDIMGQFAMSTPEACPCGVPLRAFIQRPSENLPLLVPVTNLSLADITAQVEVRGFCCSTRIC